MRCKRAVTDMYKTYDDGFSFFLFLGLCSRSKCVLYAFS